MSHKAYYTEIKKFERDLGQCMKCGFCTFWCPVYQEERVESSVARGKNRIIRGLLAGDIKYSKEYRDRISKCTLCMTCTANCPAKTNIPNVIVAGRADVVRSKGIKFPYNFLYRSLLPRRSLFGKTVALASRFQNLLFPRTQGTIRHLPMFLSALGKGRSIPQIAPRFLRQILPEVNKPLEGVETRMRVGYFTGCMADFVFVDQGKHIVDFLTRNGVEVIIPKEQGCCGAPVFLGAGDFETGKKLADTNIKAFEGIERIITSCATCVSAISDYQKYLADTPERRESYTRFGEKLKDISQFLVDELKPPTNAYQAASEIRGKKVTWHDPCHLSRHLGIRVQPREILNSIQDITYIEMPDADRCCGMAGSFSIYHYDLAKKIADKKIANIKSSEADIVATGCPGCEIQLIDGISRNKLPIKVMHLMDLIN